MFISSPLSSSSTILEGFRSTSIKGSDTLHSALSKTSHSKPAPGVLPTPPQDQKMAARSSGDSSTNTQTGTYDDNSNDDVKKRSTNSNTGPATGNNMRTAKEVTDDAPTMNPSTQGGSDLNNTSQGSQTGNNAV